MSGGSGASRRKILVLQSQQDFRGATAPLCPPVLSSRYHSSLCVLRIFSSCDSQFAPQKSSDAPNKAHATHRGLIHGLTMAQRAGAFAFSEPRARCGVLSSITNHSADCNVAVRAVKSAWSHPTTPRNGNRDGMGCQRGERSRACASGFTIAERSGPVDGARHQFLAGPGWDYVTRPVIEIRGGVRFGTGSALSRPACGAALAIDAYVFRFAAASWPPPP